jgi:hypothetical protein
MTRPRTVRSACLKTALLLAVVGAALAVGAAAASAAPKAGTSSCWREVLADWFPDGRIDKIYPLSCYREAQKHLPPDAQQYSGARDDIQRALAAAIRQQREPKDSGPSSSSSGGSSTTSSGVGPGGGGGSNDSGSGTGGGGGSSSSDSGSSGGGSKSAITRLFDRIGPANAESIPLPLLVLGGIAILLLLTAAASYGVRRYQARRLPPQEPGPEQL